MRKVHPRLELLYDRHIIDVGYVEPSRSEIYPAFEDERHGEHPMTLCSTCGDRGKLFYTCNYCDETFCPDHRLPEAHECDGVEFLSATGKRFETKTTGEVVEEGERIESPEPFEPEYTVGTTTEPAWERSPPVKLKSDTPEETDESESLLRRVLSWFR